MLWGTWFLKENFLRLVAISVEMMDYKGDISCKQMFRVEIFSWIESGFLNGGEVVAGSTWHMWHVTCDNCACPRWSHPDSEAVRAQALGPSPSFVFFSSSDTIALCHTTANLVLEFINWKVYKTESGWISVRRSTLKGQHICRHFAHLCIIMIQHITLW